MRTQTLALLLFTVGCGSPQMAKIMPVARSVPAPIPTPTRPTAPARPTKPPDLAGQWELSFMPDAQSGGLPGVPQANLVEATLKQTDTNFSSAQSAVLFEYSTDEFTESSTCLGGATSTITGTISDDGLSFNLSLSTDGITESAKTTGSVNSDGTLTGTYSGNNTGLDGCPLNSTGSFSGTPIKRQFSGTYLGELANDDIDSMETISMTFSQSGSTLNITGSDNGTAFSLSGVVIGEFFETPTFDGYLPLNDPRIWLWDEESGDQGLLELQP